VTAQRPREVFHAQVKLLPGTRDLLPLDDLAELDPATYEAGLAKYRGSPERERLRETVVPLLNRRWTQVVFLSPVHPHAIWRTWFELTGQRLPSVEFWSIPVDRLPQPSVVFDRTISTVGDPIESSEIVPLDVPTFRTSLDTTAANRAWLESLSATGRQGAWFHGVPHVLVGARVPLTGARVVSWHEDPPDPAEHSQKDAWCSRTGRS
jgi:hypothetical protein